MTFAKWFKDNHVLIWKNNTVPTTLKSFFEEAWHDGYRAGWDAGNRAASQPSVQADTKKRAADFYVR